jgi:hypothetical protein
MHRLGVHNVNIAAPLTPALTFGTYAVRNVNTDAPMRSRLTKCTGNRTRFPTQPQLTVGAVSSSSPVYIAGGGVRKREAEERDHRELEDVRAVG